MVVGKAGGGGIHRAHTHGVPERVLWEWGQVCMCVWGEGETGRDNP